MLLLKLPIIMKNSQLNDDLSQSFFDEKMKNREILRKNEHLRENYTKIGEELATKQSIAPVRRLIYSRGLNGMVRTSHSPLPSPLGSKR